MNKPKQEYCGCEIQNYAIFCHGCCKPVKPKPTGVEDKGPLVSDVGVVAKSVGEGFRGTYKNPTTTGVGSIDVEGIRGKLLLYAKEKYCTDSNISTLVLQESQFKTVANALASYFGEIVEGKDELIGEVTYDHNQLVAQLAEVTKERDAFQTQAGARKKECFLLKKENEDLKHRWIQMGG